MGGKGAFKHFFLRKPLHMINLAHYNWYAYADISKLDL